MSQKDKQVNVPRDVEDEFYRYKMPVLRAKVEGRGNGIKTVIENCQDIAKALDRNPEYVNKYFGFELGALTSNLNDKYIVNGRHDADTLARVLDGFIEKFVLCGGCKNPETNMVIKGDKIFLVCRACGKMTQCDPANRLVPYMTKRDDKKPQPQKKVPGKVVKQTEKDEEDDEEDWFLPTSKEAVEERRREILGHNDRLTAPSDKTTGEGEGDGDGDGTTATTTTTTATTSTATTTKPSEIGLTLAAGQNAVDLLEKYWATNPREEEVFNKVNALATAQAWSEGTLLRTYVFPSLFAKDIKKDFYKKARYLNCFVKNNKKQQKVVLFSVEKLCHIVPATLPMIPSFLNGLYVEEVLDEENLVLWYKHPVNDPKRFDKKVSKAIRDAAKPFIEWLQKAEEEDSEDF